ncbi:MULTISPECIES: RcnB family protein [Caulobacter]|jgi:Ni/Co efflux regulator RcnB|uniref:Putative integral membrane protein n=1 Tax=Caulobacter vibrioides OR37 TaxID=1292034 RepID=R0EFV0_CAUVI|nr:MULTISPECIES: RcnB family protein [Caulobacter]ENZ80929.1 putative integral membrane protein [Caulobacter vibrioides OR37]MBQ1561079.1 RcnB family protein [Caulobacter sp.]
MKRILTTSVALLMLGGAANAASAQDYRHDGRYDGRDRAYQQGRFDQARRDDRRDDWRHDHRRWNRGERLDPRWRGNAYYVSDWRAHHLRPPPRGYRWHRVNDQYVLAAVATGVIASVILADR